MKLFYIYLLLCCTFLSSSITAQTKQASPQFPEKLLINDNGSFLLDFTETENTKEKVSETFNDLLNLTGDHTFIEISSQRDDLGFSHSNFQHYYKGIPVEGNTILVHTKKNIVQSINGRISRFEEVALDSHISIEEAKIRAKNFLGVDSLIADYPIETVIVSLPEKEENTIQIAHKVRVDSYQPFEMANVFVNAQNGVIIKKINLIAHADTPGTAETLYSGQQNITCDMYSGQYRLRESARNIQTYNATDASDFTASGFQGSSDYSNPSVNWAGITTLTSLTITSVSQDWWYTAIADEIPDLYIDIYDVNNNLIYTSNYYNDTFPQLNFNGIDLELSNGPYTIELWDYDPVGSDDFGGSTSLSLVNSGTHSWSINGNTGTFTVDTSTGNPALDVHWGMEVTYDFYLNELNRNSYDGNGGIIRNYINPPTHQEAYGNTPNNAGALGAPYNIMLYGLGDGSNMTPVVGLDVEGHEFTHLVVNHNGNGGLIYEGESGALNESFADIFGTCVEFYSGHQPDWLIGEDVIVGGAMRSMITPNLGYQPDTYEGDLWEDPTNLGYDSGGVHINSGVMNYWFYLLSQGGSGTNDIGDYFNVTPIGMSDAKDIAYRNLIHYLSPNATFQDAYYGSLLAAEDLYGDTSSQYTAVQDAWYAVGIGAGSIEEYCSGTTTLTSANDTFSDGSDSSNYLDNSNCSWLISPENASSIVLNFSEFNTEGNYDKVFVYDGNSADSPLLGQFSGNDIPEEIISTGGEMFIEFVSDNSVTESGWTAYYTSGNLGIEEELLKNNMKIFPNPSNGNFSIQSDSNQKLTIKIFDITGKLVLETFTINKGDNPVDATTLSKGTYLLSVEMEGARQVEKIIIR